MIHENFSQFRKVTPGSDRSFCLTFSLVFAIVGFYFISYHNSVKLWALVVSTVFLIMAVTKPQAIKPLNRIWIGIGVSLGRVITPIAMGILYFSGFSFIAIVAKILRKRFLSLDFSAAKKTFWITKKNTVLSEKTFSNPF